MGGWRSEEGVGVLRVFGAETLDSLRGENRHPVVGIGSMLLELTASCLQPMFRKASIPSDQGEEAAATDESQLGGLGSCDPF